MSRDIIVTGMCLWEAVLDLRVSMPQIEAAIMRHGTATVRDSIAALAPQCDAAWNALPDDACDTICFDWDFVPLFVQTRIDWSNVTLRLNFENLSKDTTL